ncbi:response regulator [Hydrogenophaga atypica]|uniref:Response regulator n=1 Tax=Hydrogenophaga atypica TaxID=249409 RepID=A0ABW2QLY5_9BURK
MNNPSLVRADVASASNYYTTIEVAKMLGMAVRSVQLMVDRGDLQAWKTPGGHRRISRESLERWLQGSRSGVRAEAAGRQEGEVGAGRESSRRLRLGQRPPRLLLIEDSTHFQNLVALLLKQKFPGLEVHVASDGITGLASFGQLQPDLLVVDIMLPGIDGANLITGLRSHALFGQCKLIVLTALDEAQRAPYAFALDQVPVVHKPRLVNDLPPLIESLLGARVTAATQVGRADEA